MTGISLGALRALFRAGHAPAGLYFFLLAQEKSNQKEGHPLHRPLRELPALFAKPGGCATRAIRCADSRSDSARRLPPGLAALLGGAAGAPKKQTVASDTTVLRKFVISGEKINRFSRGDWWNRVLAARVRLPRHPPRVARR